MLPIVVTVLESGRVVQRGGADAVITHAEHAYARELLAAVPDPFGTAGRG